MSVNKVILVGNVGKDPEVREVSNTKVANFSLATTERGFTTQSGTVVPEKTEWHNLVAWRGLAEIAEKYIRKGSQLYIEGKLQTRSWEKDGIKHYSTDIVVENLQMLGGKPKEGEAKPAGAFPAPTKINLPEPASEDGDGLPF